MKLCRDARSVNNIDAGTHQKRPRRRARKELAKEGWRLLGTPVHATGPHNLVFLVFERETGGGRGAQDIWRAQHGGQDAG